MKNSTRKLSKTMPWYLITGGVTGIGYVTMSELAKLNKNIILLTDNIERGEKTVSKLKTHIPNANIQVCYLNLTDLKTIKKFYKEHKSIKISGIINTHHSAYIPERQLTKSGIEKNFAQNFLGHFYLTKLFLNNLITNARVINLTSNGYKTKAFKFDDPNFENNYRPGSAYINSQLANILSTYYFGTKFSKKSKYRNKNLKAIICHTGILTSRKIAQYNPKHDYISKNINDDLLAVYYATVSLNVDNLKLVAPKSFGARFGKAISYPYPELDKIQTNSKRIVKLAKKLIKKDLKS